jgi:tetratricopeptide (TPR) repeat protein
MSRAFIGASLVLVVAATLPALAQGVSNAAGEVVDREGNPVPGAVVTFYAKSNMNTPYTGTTNKKGRYFVNGMFTGKEGEFWIMELEVEGQIPIEVRIVSRTVNRVLIDEMTTKLRPGKKPPEIIIRPLGKATVDWTVAPAEEYEAELLVTPEAGGVVAEGEEGAGQAEPARDPWAEALTLAAAGSFEQALEFFGEAVEDQPDDAERHETYAKVLFRLEQFDEAEVAARRAIELDPTRVASQMVLFSAYEARGELEQAREVLDAASVASPGNTRILERLAYVAGELGDTDAAIAAYTEVTTINPDHGAAWAALGGVYADAGQLEQSELAYQKVVEIDPERAHQTYFNIGVLILKRPNRSTADKARAIEAFRKALAIKPDYGRAALELSFALLGTGDKDGARSVLEACLRENPEGPEASQMKGLLENFQ